MLFAWPGNSMLATHTQHTGGHSILWHGLREACNDATANRHSSFNQSLFPFLWESKPHLSGFWESPLLTYWFLRITGMWCTPVPVGVGFTWTLTHYSWPNYMSNTVSLPLDSQAVGRCGCMHVCLYVCPCILNTDVF